MDGIRNAVRSRRGERLSQFCELFWLWDPAVPQTQVSTVLSSQQTAAGVWVPAVSQALVWGVYGSDLMNPGAL